MFNQNTKFLVVDDSLSMRKILKKNLSEIGYSNIIEAETGREAYDVLVEHSKTPAPIEFIISDWNMPNMKGIDFLKKCKSEDEFKAIPFVIVTAEHEIGRVTDAYEAGALDYILKPFNAETLKTKLETYFKKLNTTSA